MSYTVVHTQRFKQSGSIFLLQHDDYAGTYEYFVVRVFPHKERRFRHVLARLPFALEEFGEVLLQGAGPLQPAHVWRQLSAMGVTGKRS